MADVNANIGSISYQEKTILMGIQPSIVRSYPCDAATVLAEGTPVGLDAANEVVEWNPDAADGTPEKTCKGILLKAISATDELADVITMGFVKADNIAFSDDSAPSLAEVLILEQQHIYLQG